MNNENPTLSQVLEALNKGMVLSVCAKELDMKLSIFESKLSNAAIVKDLEKGIWVYECGNEEESLSRPIKNKIVKLKCDKPDAVDVEKDMEYELYKDCQIFKWSDLTAKKSFHLEQELFDEIKQLSFDRSIKINVLVNNLLAKGLEHYEQG
ncbi:hypothetical protein [Solibacillus sp. CAU 1738]|uniref:hypothetical protein n=1 Tax=Solibacillus sp. CAU 1738 TaxID=3140363 RepID=UPI003261018C